MKVNPRLQIYCFSLIVGMLFLCFLKTWYLDIINIIVGVIAFCMMNKAFLNKILKKIRKRVRKKG